jgi:hypothetical protein
MGNDTQDQKGPKAPDKTSPSSPKDYVTIILSSLAFIVSAISAGPKAPDKTSSWSPKDYVTITFSSLAFIVSAISAYFNVIRIEDNISLAVQFRAFATREDKNFSISAQQETPVVFINSGNRPVAILSLDFVYIQIEDRTVTFAECTGKHTTVLHTDFDTLIVKPNDFAVKRVKITDAIWYLKDQIKKSDRDNYLFPIWSGVQNKSSISIDVCAVTLMTTPDESRYYANVLIHKYTAEPGRWSYSSQSEGDTSSRPRNLVKKVKTRL